MRRDGLRGVRGSVRLAALVLVASAGTAGGWWYLRAGTDGPLDGGDGTGVVLPGTSPGTVYSLGGLFLQNTGSHDVTIEKVEVVAGGGGLEPSGPVRISGPERIDALQSAGFVSWPGPPPAQMPVEDPAGYVVPGSGTDAGETFEIVYTVTTPSVPNSWIAGVDITYRAGLRRYTERFRSVVSLCTPAYTGTCPDHSSGR